MSDTDDPALAAARLEEALDRIAALADALTARAAEPAPAPETVPEPAPAAGMPAVDVQAVAERLDALIARLRAALASRPA